MKARSRPGDSANFASVAVVSPHHLASAAGLEVLAAGGNALDACIAANATLGVVAPYLCGYGGDLFAIVFDGAFHAYNGSGRSSSSATLEAVTKLASADNSVRAPSGMPEYGALTVTVPGAVEAWFALLERFGTLSFERLSKRALQYAEGGVPLTMRTARRIEQVAGARAAGEAAFSEWRSIYCPAARDRRLVQTGLARTIRALSDDGPDAFYRGRIAAGISSTVESAGGLLNLEDLASHSGDFVDCLRHGYRDVEVLELPPNTQGVVALEALGLLEALGPLPPDGVSRQHLMIEATKLALSDRAALSDPAWMKIDVSDLLGRQRLEDLARLVDRAHVGTPPLDHVRIGGTAYLAAADESGMCVSLIQSNYRGFGSGITVPDWGINLHNRGCFFSLDPEHANVVAPSKRPMHTLMPAMALREGRPSHVFGTMGGDGQPQIHVQLLARMIDDACDLQPAVDAPRWILDLGDWSVVVEDRFDPEVVAGLRALGHEVKVTSAFDDLMGHAHVLGVGPDRIVGAVDPRSEGAVVGF